MKVLQVPEAVVEEIAKNMDESYRLYSSASEQHMQYFVDKGLVKLQPSNPNNYAKLTKAGLEWKEGFKPREGLIE